MYKMNIPDEVRELVKNGTPIVATKRLMDLNSNLELWQAWDIVKMIENGTKASVKGL